VSNLDFGQQPTGPPTAASLSPEQSGTKEPPPNGSDPFAPPELGPLVSTGAHCCSLLLTAAHSSRRSLTIKIKFFARRPGGAGAAS